MIYEIVTTEKFDKSFKKLDRQIQRMMKAWIEKNLVQAEDPRQHGKGLTANRSGQWRYRIGDYRILAEIQDRKLVLILIDVKHRIEVYKKQREEYFYRTHRNLALSHEVSFFAVEFIIYLAEWKKRALSTFFFKIKKLLSRFHVFIKQQG